MRRMLDPKTIGGGGGGESNALYEYTAVFYDTSKLGVSRKAKFYSSVDIVETSKDRTSEELYEQLIPAGSGYELSLDAFGCAKMTTDSNDTYYPIIEVTISPAETSVYYIDPYKGKTKHPHTFWNSIKWNVIRNIASPRKAN